MVYANARVHRESRRHRVCSASAGILLPHTSAPQRRMVSCHPARPRRHDFFINAFVQHETRLLEFNTLSFLSYLHTKLLCSTTYKAPRSHEESAHRTAYPAHSKSQQRPAARSQTSHSGKARTPTKRDLNTRQQTPPWIDAISIALWSCHDTSFNMTEVGNGLKADGSQLRERPSAKPMHMQDAEAAKQKVLELNEQEDGKSEREKKTYGRTPDGTGKY